MIIMFTFCWLDITSRYMHIVDEDAAIVSPRQGGDYPVKHSATAVFRFKACQTGRVAKVEVHSVRCKDIAQRGRVPLPPGWAVALEAACLHQSAAAATQQRQSAQQAARSRPQRPGRQQPEHL